MNHINQNFTAGIIRIILVLILINIEVFSLKLLHAETYLQPKEELIADGKMIAFSRTKGNCLACHQIQGGEFSGNIGPPLIAMKTRFTTKEHLRDQIWDAVQRNPETSMPPFGRNGILSEEEINKVIEFVWTL